VAWPWTGNTAKTKLKSPLAPFVMATVHPSAILRARDGETRHAETRRFVDDLRTVAGVLQSQV
jgi:DNA polymerase